MLVIMLIHKDIEIRVNESFTELLTIIINSILISKNWVIQKIKWFQVL